MFPKRIFCGVKKGGRLTTTLYCFIDLRIRIQKQQFGHGQPQRISNFHVRIRIVSVMVICTTVHMGRRRRNIHGRDIALEFRVLALGCISTDGHLRLKDLECTALHVRGIHTNRRQGKFGLGGMKLVSQLMNELDQILFVPLRIRFCSSITIALPPDKAGYFVLCRQGIIRGQIIQNGLGITDINICNKTFRKTKARQNSSLVNRETSESGPIVSLPTTTSSLHYVPHSFPAYHSLGFTGGVGVSLAGQRLGYPP
jgi:hypothetical protein